jgi:hypothetical protein
MYLKISNDFYDVHVHHPTNSGKFFVGSLTYRTNQILFLLVAATRPSALFPP